MTGEKILHYKILKKIGQGGMGIVYKAEDSKLKRDVAIKFLPKSFSANEEERKRFEVEAQAAASLNHPNIATVFSIEETDDQLFIVMEYIEGKELKEIITPLTKSGDTVGLQIKEAVNYAIQIAEGLEAAHKKGIVHRDIKPQNILLTTDGKVKIMDFGLAKVVQNVNITKVGTALGTAAYMSPEQAKGDLTDHRTDIWSLGVVLYEMITGVHPFKGEYEQAILYNIINEKHSDIKYYKTDVPDKLQLIINKMLEKDPGLRYGTMQELVVALSEIQNPTIVNKKDQDPFSIAVLPFSDISQTKDQDYFCEGVAEEIINSLSKIKDIRVSSRTSSFQFKENKSDIREIGKRLNVNSVLEGSVRKAGSKLRINVQLTNVSDGFYLWSERYDRELEDVFAIQEDIAENVITSLKGVLTPVEKVAIQRPETTIEAYEYFLKGRQLFHKLLLKQAKILFEKAIDLDSEYALAYAGLADTHSWMYEWEGGKDSDLIAAEKNSLKALTLAPHLSESHSSRGFVLSLSKKYDEAEEEFKEAIRINSNSFDGYYLYGRACFARGQIEKSAELFLKASEVRQDDFQSLILLAQSLKIMGKDKNQEILREGITRAKKHLEFNPNDRRALSLTSGSLFDIGEKDEAFKFMDKALKLYPNDADSLINGACLYAKSGNKVKAIDLLEKAAEQGFGKKEWIENDPDYDSLRNEPRFIKLLKKLK